MTFIKRVIKKLKKINAVFNYLFKQISFNTDYYQTRMLVENRILLKKMTNQKLNIVLIAFEPATWLMFQSIYDTFSKSDQVNITVLVIPYAHSTLLTGTYKDDGLREYLDTLGIPYIYGYNEKTNTWIDIFSLHPDYVFYQAPYNGMYPDSLKSDYVCRLAQICYLPYGAFLQSEVLEEIVHPKDFFEDAAFFFLPTRIHKEIMIENSLRRSIVFDNSKLIVSGLTKTDYLSDKRIDFVEGKKNDFTILWTPRWNTSEGVCTFFDYYEYLVDLTNTNQDINLIFRPHPLMFQNFLKTGELSKDDVEKIENDFSVANRIIDKDADYTADFKKADVLISDVSSMMYEFFLYKKPIIYTHKTFFFNKFANKMSKTFYWSHNVEEMNDIILSLLRKEDIKKNDRLSFIKDYMASDTTAAECILNSITK
ncbi:MAG: CDP-glycerol glycerophosphotransferase family protein [Treponema sp.]